MKVILRSNSGVQLTDNASGSKEDVILEGIRPSSLVTVVAIGRHPEIDVV